MTNIVDTIRSLPMLEQMGGVSRSDIVDAELQLRTSFSEEYKDYLLTFGAISAKSIELTGIIKAEYLNVVAVTKQEWELNVNVPHNMYVIENTYIDGIIIWQSTSGEIFKTTPGSAPKMIAPSLNVYIQEHMK